MSAARIERVRAGLAGQGLDGLIVNRYENRRWLSGVTAHDASPTAGAGWILVGRDDAVLVTTFLYYGAAVDDADGVSVVRAEQRIHETIAGEIATRGLRRVGFDPTWFTVQMHSDLAAALDGAAELAPVGPIVEPLRAVKDDAEVEQILVAVRLADQAMEALFGELRPGMTEVEAAWFLESYMRQRGAEGMAFEPGVAAGPNSAVPHHKPSDRPIQTGEPIWIDIGARVDGYCSDITRSVALGRADDEYRRVWQAVLDAQRKALDFIRPGRSSRECDLVARDYLGSVGLGDAFGHSLGHGVGLEIHEAPRLSRLVDEPLEAGMIVTVEPGAYLEGWGGIRHEELTLVTADGLRVLSRASKPLIL